MKYCNHVVTVLLWLITFVNCYRVCDIQADGKKICCTHFQNANGKCIECPKGSFGEDCAFQCSYGYYGVGCKATCKCIDNQICDVQECCVQNKTMGCPRGWFGDKCQLPAPEGYYGFACKGTCNCTDDQICDVREGCVQDTRESTSDIIDTTNTEQQTKKSPELKEVFLWYQLFGIPLGVVIFAMILLTVHGHRKWTSGDQESGLRHDKQNQEARSPAVELNKNTEESVYEEICEFDTGCSHTHTFSSDSVSFSRSRGTEVNRVQQKESTILYIDAIAR